MSVRREIFIDGRGAALEFDESRFTFDDVERVYSIAPLTTGSFSVLIGERSYEAVVNGREIIVDGRSFNVDVFDPREMRGRKSADADQGRANIAAMMPGKVVRVLVAEGDEVEAGQGLIVVEAMKMQNEMKAPKAGRVIEMKSREGATVAAGEILLVIE